jgi:hypothetical protein
MKHNLTNILLYVKYLRVVYTLSRSETVIILPVFPFALLHILCTTEGILILKREKYIFAIKNDRVREIKVPVILPE